MQIPSQGLALARARIDTLFERDVLVSRRMQEKLIVRLHALIRIDDPDRCLSIPLLSECLQRDVRRMCLDATWRSSAAPSVQKSCWMTIRADRSELSSRLHANVLYATKVGTAPSSPLR